MFSSFGINFPVYFVKTWCLTFKNTFGTKKCFVLSSNKWKICFTYLLPRSFPKFFRHPFVPEISFLDTMVIKAIYEFYIGCWNGPNKSRNGNFAKNFEIGVFTLSAEAGKMAFWILLCRNGVILSFSLFYFYLFLLRVAKNKTRREEKKKKQLITPPGAVSDSDWQTPTLLLR